uniref:Uncharacterized protein n=1 Tax=Inoviridae sp. ctjYd14 TaxID=2825784 RepID=A0A8S5RTT0_9VIRU|nr:MAG TPA: hypothetical protein [Inoviridae sp. ctjYd14]
MCKVKIVCRGDLRKKCENIEFYFAFMHIMTSGAIASLFTMPAATLSTLTATGGGIATGIVTNGWIILGIGATIWGGKYLLRSLLGLFKRSAR